VRAPLNPRIAGVRASMLVHLYRMRLRSHAIQEMLAGSGIAVGVALVLGVLVANTSLTGSANELVHQMVGHARLQLSSRSQEGFDQSLVARTERLPSVRVAVGVLRENVAVVGRRGRAAVQLLGVTPAVEGLDGFGTSDFGPSGFRLAGGLLLPSVVAEQAGAHPGDPITVLALGHSQSIQLGAVLSRAPFGAVSASPIAVTTLTTAQRLTRLPRRITQILVEPRPGAEAAAARELRTLAGSRLDVGPADNELRLLEQAAAPNNDSTELFAAISVMVGFLLSLNAMLLTVPERRRFVADLRMQGYDWRQIVVLLVFQATVLGLVASSVGVVLGDLLSHAFLHRVPAYLATAFPVGSEEILSVSTVLIALGCGVLATVIASLSPVLDLRPNRPVDAVLRDREGGSEVIPRRTTVWVSIVGALSVIAIVGLVLALPDLTIAGGVALALSTLCAIPSMFAVIAGSLRWTAERVRSSTLIVVVSELRATTTRAVALAGIAALAVYGSIAIGGARDDLLHGLDANFTEYLQTADIWVTTGGNDLTTNAFFTNQRQLNALAAVPGVASARTYQGGFLDVGRRRMWIIARPPGDRPLLPSSQLVHGGLARATALLRASGWVGVSGGFASEHHLHVGDHFTLPTPTGNQRLGVAAITSNLGWAPGAVIMNTSDYRRFWQTDMPTAIEINLRAGANVDAVAGAVKAALRDSPGLTVQTFRQRQSQYATDSHQGLQALSQIATLLLIAAGLAVASALSAAIWQRRARLASLKIQGYDTIQLWRALLLESAIVLGVGCTIGAMFGVSGHALASRWLRLHTGFPAPFSIGFASVFLTFSLLAIIALGVISLPGFAAARAPARTSFQE